MPDRLGDAEPAIAQLKPMEIFTLVDSLKKHAGWELYNFGYDGPNPPYVRIGTKIRLSPLRMEHVFESFKPDKFLFRSRIPIAKHLRFYRWIKIQPIVFEEAYGRKFATDEHFPFNQWLSLHRITFYGLELGSVVAPLELPHFLLSHAAGIWLKEDE